MAMSLINSITSLPEPAVPEQIVKLPSSWNVTASIPKKIHQCWKTADLPPWAASAGWQGSPGFEYKLWTDETMLRFVTDYYPQFLPLYNASRPVERADFFRYLILFDQGGYYSDLDVTLVVALNEWSGRHPGAKVFVGLERAPTGRNWNRWFARRFQIVQWTLASVPGHPIFHRVLMLIWQRWKQHGSRLYGNLSANVMDTTGPGIWSDAVSDVLRQRGIILGPSPLNASFVTQNGVREGEIVLLPQLGFGRTGNDVFSSSTLVQHEFQGSWKGVADFMPPKGFYDSDTKGGWENPLAEPGNTTIQDCGDRCLDFVGCKAYEVRHAKGPTRMIMSKQLKLTEDCKQQLLDKLAIWVPTGWVVVCDHVTLDYTRHRSRRRARLTKLKELLIAGTGTPATVRATHIGWSRTSLGVKGRVSSHYSNFDYAAERSHPSRLGSSKPRSCTQSRSKSKSSSPPRTMVSSEVWHKFVRLAEANGIKEPDIGLLYWETVEQLCLHFGMTHP
ncbi:Initiation-specific alpha-1, partial [Diplonema papillatum]